MKTFELNTVNLEYGDNNGSCVLSKDEKIILFNSREYISIKNKPLQSFMKLNKYTFSSGKVETIDTVFISNKSILAPNAWRGGLVAISDTSYVYAYQVLDTFSKSRLDFKVYTELYCFTDKGDSLWTYTCTGTDSVTYLGEVFCKNNQIFVFFQNCFNWNSSKSIGSVIKLNTNGQLIRLKYSEERLKNGINGYNDFYFKDSIIYSNFAFYPTIGPSSEGVLYKWDSAFNALDSIFLLIKPHNTKLLKLLSVKNNVFTYYGFWDTAYPYDPKLKDALHYVYYVAKVDMNGKLLGRYFLDDGVKQNFFNAGYAIQQKNGNILIPVNEDSKLPENDYGNVNIGLYCMSPNGTIKWKRKYFTHRRPQNDTYSADIVLGQNDDIYISGWANNMYDTTDMEWDILLISADSNGCITGKDCTNYYVPTVSVTETPQPIPWVVYPNPSSGRFTILLSTPTNQNSIVQITDMSGKTVWQEKIQEGVFDIPVNISGTKTGFYSLQMIDDKRQITGSRKIWIEN